MRWYQIFAGRYSGRYGLEMHLRYDQLESHWDNLLGVIRWCMEQKRYDDSVTLGNHLRDFTYMYSYWADRPSVLDWLMVEVGNHRDCSIHLNAWGCRGYP